MAVSSLWECANGSGHCPWRLIFRWDGGRGEASEVYLDDHSYR